VTNTQPRDLGDYAQDPRIGRVVDNEETGSWSVDVGDGRVWLRRPTGDWGAWRLAADGQYSTALHFPDLASAIRHLIGEPMSPLAYALQQALTAEQRAFLANHTRQATLDTIHAGDQDGCHAWAILGNALNQAQEI
jgi:hypothetical protein